MSSDVVNQIKNAFSCDSPSAELFVCDTTASTNEDARAYASSGSGKNATITVRFDRDKERMLSLAVAPIVRIESD